MPRILHIEDDPANRLLVRKLLTPAGFEVIDAVDGLDGIRSRYGHSAVVVGRSVHLLGTLRQNPDGFILRTPSLTK